MPNRQNYVNFHQSGMPFFQGACFCWEKKKWLVSEAHGVVRVRLLPWPSCLPDEQNHGLQAGTWTFQKHGFVTDSDPHGSKSGSEGIPWQLFSRRISWEEPNPTKMQEMGRKNRGFPEKSAKFRENRRNSGKSPEIARDRLKPGQKIQKSYYLGVWGVGGMAGGP